MIFFLNLHVSMHQIFQNLRGNNLLRFIDRYFFIPIVCLLGLMKHGKKKPEKIETIGILLLAAIGDSIIAIAPLMDIAKKYPETKITLFATKENAGVFKLFPHKFTIEIIDLRKIFKTISIIKNHRFDVLIDCSQWVRISAILCFFSGARFTVGFKTAKQFRHFGYDFYVSHSNAVHEIDNYRNLVKVIDVISNSLPSAIVTDDARKKVAALNLNNYVVFHPWPSGYRKELKRWSEENWVKLAHYVLSLGYTLIITGGTSDEVMTRELLTKINHEKATSFTGHTFMETAALLEKARLLITVNTGIMHLAAALNVLTIVLNGPSNQKRWGPLSDKAVVIVPSGVVHGYLNLGFEYPHGVIDCMQYISVEEVKGKTANFLAH